MKQGKMFQILIANFANHTRQILEEQMVATALINPKCLVRSTLIVQELLGIVDEFPATSMESSKLLRFRHALPSGTSKGETKGS